MAKMKPTVFLINTARGPLIDEQALADALNSGKIAGAACDVVSAKPILPGNPTSPGRPPKPASGSWKPQPGNITAFMSGKPMHLV